VQFGGGFAYEFLGDGDVKFGPGYSVETDTSGASGELALRAQFTVAEGVTAFGDLTGRKGLGNDAIDSYGGLIGIKVDFWPPGSGPGQPSHSNHPGLRGLPRSPDGFVPVEVRAGYTNRPSY